MLLATLPKQKIIPSDLILKEQTRGRNFLHSDLFHYKLLLGKICWLESSIATTFFEIAVV